MQIDLKGDGNGQDEELLMVGPCVLSRSADNNFSRLRREAFVSIMTEFDLFIMHT